MTADRPMLGILLMLGFCVVAPLGDSFAKLLGEPSVMQPLGQILFIRFLLQVVFLVPIVVVAQRPWRMGGRVLYLVILRTFMHLLGIGMMFSALRYLPLADAVAIAFVMPFILLLLGWAFLKEEVGVRRLAACAVGFAGVLMVVQPSFAQVGWPALLPLGVALNFALFILVTRKIAKDTDPIGMQAVSGVIAMIIMLPLLALGTALDVTEMQFAPVLAHAGWLLLGVGFFGTLAHLLMTWSLRYAPSATLAPMQYLEIPFATFIGWAIFAEFPNGLAAIGIVVTVVAGLYIIIREQAIAQRSTATPITET